MAKKRGHGEGGISQRKDGRWMGQITLGIDPATKKAKRITFYGKTRREVQDKIREALNLKERGLLSEPSKLTIEEWLDTWMDDYKKQELKPSTWVSYKSLIENYIKPNLGKFKLNKLRTNDIQRFYNNMLENGRKATKPADKQESKGLSTRTVKYIHTILKAALAQAEKEGHIQGNPAAATTQPRQTKKEITPLSVEQVQHFLSSVKDNWLYPLFVMDLGTGLRRGELLGLKWDDINLMDNTATIRRSLLQIKGQLLLQEDTKTKASKATVKLPGTVAKELKKVKKQQAKDRLFLGEAYQDLGFVFAWPDGHPIRPDYLYHQFKTLLKENGLPDVRFHDLRHTFCTLLLEAGEDLATVSKLARHSSYSITADIYGHLTKKMQDQAADKLDIILKDQKKNREVK